LPWGTWPPFPWLHEHAQWSDAVFAAAAVLFVVERMRAGKPVRFRLFHAGMALYLGMAAVSLAQAEPQTESGKAKLLGMAMLVALTLVTAEFAEQKDQAKAITRVVAGTSLAVAAAAIAGVALALAGVMTPLVGAYGDLVPGAYARAQAGFPHPNLLASYCVFAAGVVGRDEEAVPEHLRRIVLGALLVTVLLTFSRTILAFGLAVLIRKADTPKKRKLALLYAAGATLAVVVLSAFNLRIDPTRPQEARLLEAPGSRAQSFTTAFAALKTHPWLGTGPGSSPARKDGAPFDAHCTPLNIAATLGLPALLGFALVPIGLWRARATPTDRAMWGMLAGFALDGLAQDVEDFRHLWIAFGLCRRRPC
jgi:hypothetical protein